MSFDEIFDLTAGAYFHFSLHPKSCGVICVTYRDLGVITAGGRLKNL